jgi:mannosyltransferase
LYEGFGIPVLEAQAAGCPVIASDCSSIPEVAGNGAILFSDNNIETIIENIIQLEDSSFRNDLIKKGLINSAKFTWDKTFSESMQLYKLLYYK